MWPKTEKSYQVYIKKLWWEKPIIINAYSLDSNQKIDLSDKNFFIEKLSKYGFEIKNINNTVAYKFTSPKYFDVCNIDFYLVTLINNKQIGIIEIVDFCVNEKYRNKGIGSQFIKILDNIALNNNIGYIVGELEGNNKGEPLNRRKKFYIKNKFIVEATEKSKLSGFIVKKCLKDIIQL